MSVLLSGSDAACTKDGSCRNEYTSEKRFIRVHWGLTEVPGDIPDEAKRVDLNHNEITTVPVGVFSHLRQCVTLVLSYNKISIIRPGMFTGLYNLQHLSLHGNLIRIVEMGAFDSLYFLSEISLYYNRLRTMSPHLLTNLPRPIKLDMRIPSGQTNQWHCSSLCWLKHEEQHGTVVWRDVESDPRCADGSQWKTMECGDPGENCRSFTRQHQKYYCFIAQWLIFAAHMSFTSFTFIWWRVISSSYFVSWCRSLPRAWRSPILHQNKVQWSIFCWFQCLVQLFWWNQWNHHMSERWRMDTVPKIL